MGGELLSNCQANVVANRALLAARASDRDDRENDDAVGNCCVRVRELDWNGGQLSSDAGATTSAAAADNDDDAKWRWTAEDRELCVPLSSGPCCCSRA